MENWYGTVRDEGKMDRIRQMESAVIRQVNKMKHHK